MGYPVIGYDPGLHTAATAVSARSLPLSTCCQAVELLFMIVADSPLNRADMVAQSAIVLAAIFCDDGFGADELLVLRLQHILVHGVGALSD